MALEEIASLRLTLRSLRAAISTEARLDWQNAGLQHAAGLWQQISARAEHRPILIGSYQATQDEANPSLLDDYFRRQGARVLYPRCVDTTLHFSAAPLQSGRFGIKEPTESAEEYFADHLHAILIPLLGFSERGDRLGQGRGFYDRALARPGVSALRIGVAFECQRAEWTQNQWDQPLDVLMLGPRLLQFQRRVSASL